MTPQPDESVPGRSGAARCFNPKKLIVLTKTQNDLTDLTVGFCPCRWLAATLCSERRASQKLRAPQAAADFEAKFRKSTQPQEEEVEEIIEEEVIEEIIEEAFERCGLQVRMGYDLKTARRSLNLMFSEWANA